MALLADTIVCQLLKNKMVVLLFSSFLILSCTGKENTNEVKEEKEVLPFYNSADFDAEWIAENDERYSKIHTIDTFALSNQQGNIITKDSLEGHIYVANFFFSICPSICPKMIGNLSKLQKTYSNNPQIKLVSFSVMPWVDSVARLKRYGEDHQINPSQWYLLTGSKERIYNLARQSFFAEKGLGLKKTTNQFLHTESMLLIDKKSRIRGVYNATQVVDIERITDDINTLLKE
jgi:protein SCO1